MRAISSFFETSTDLVLHTTSHILIQATRLRYSKSSMSIHDDRIASRVDDSLWYRYMWFRQLDTSPYTYYWPSDTCIMTGVHSFITHTHTYTHHRSLNQPHCSTSTNTLRFIFFPYFGNFVFALLRQRSSALLHCFVLSFISLSSLYCYLFYFYRLLCQ